MTIGLLTPGLAGVTRNDSGIAVHFRHLADGLQEVGEHPAPVVIAPTDQPFAPCDLPYPVSLVHVPPPPNARLWGLASWQLHQWACLRASIRQARKAAEAATVDIWETTSTGALALRFLRQPRRAPVIVRVSTTSSQLRSTNAGATTWVGRRVEAWERATVRAAECVVTHSASHRAHIAAEFGLAPASIPIVPHGIPIPRPEPHGRDDRTCHVLFVGRFEHRKGIDLLLGALPAFLAAVPQARVCLVGADSNRHWQKHWQETALAALREQVEFAGVLSNEALAQRFRAADIFVAPSRYESFGLIFVEAMANALPVLALRAPGASDVLEHERTGLLVSEAPGELAQALIQLARDPIVRRRLGAEGRRVAETRFSIPALTAASLALYRDVLARNGRAQR
jgi:glycosyltransferase involved in cell wall biosynthesis